MNVKDLLWKTVIWTVTRVTHYNGQAKNKYTYDYDKSHILNLDFNNIYWHALSQSFPHSWFEFAENLLFKLDFSMNYDKER